MLTYLGTRSSSLLSRSGLVDHGVDHSLGPRFTIFQPCFWLRKRLECDTCTFDRVSFVWLTLAIATIPFSWLCFCQVEHCQLTTCNVWHKGLPDHFRPCQNTWAPHYAAAHDWLKSKGVSALTDRSGVVYSSGQCIQRILAVSMVTNHFLWFSADATPAFISSSSRADK